MGKRRDPRIQAKLQVRIARIDDCGRRLLQTGATVHGANQRLCRNRYLRCLAERF